MLLNELILSLCCIFQLNNGDKQKKRTITSARKSTDHSVILINHFYVSLEQTQHASNIFQPLRDMGLEMENRKNYDIDELVSNQKHHENHHLTMPKQQYIENWLDRSEFERLCKKNSIDFAN